MIVVLEVMDVIRNKWALIWSFDTILSTMHAFNNGIYGWYKDY